MDWMEFVIALLDKLAWPVVVVLGIIMFRKALATLISESLGHLIEKTEKIKIKDAEFEFGEGLTKAAEEAVNTIPDMRQDEKSRLIGMVKHYPNGAVLDAWKILEHTAIEVIQEKQPDAILSEKTPYKDIGRVLGDDIISVKMEKIFNDLRQLRNKVAHAKGYQVDKVEAIEYIELCFKLNDYLRSLM